MVACSAIIRLMASSGDDRAVRLWDLSNPENEPTVLKGHTAPITALGAAVILTAESSTRDFGEF